MAGHGCADFNEILTSEEKVGGVARAHQCIDLFRSTINLCELLDIGFEGDTFIGRNHIEDMNFNICKSMDKVVENVQWCENFPASRVLNGVP